MVHSANTYGPSETARNMITQVRNGAGTLPLYYLNYGSLIYCWIYAVVVLM